MAAVNFYRGLKTKYSELVYTDGIFFATDTQEIIMNGKSFGGGSIKSASFSNGVLTLTFLSGETIDIALSNATTTEAGLMSASDKTSLDLLASGAVCGVTYNADSRKLLLTDKDGTQIGEVLLVYATDSRAGLMSASDKIHLDAAQENVIEEVQVDGNALTVTDKAVNVDLSGKQDKLTAGDNITIDGTTISAKDTTYSNASADTAGLMSAEDKAKLDTISEGSTKVVVDTELSSTSTNPV